DVLAKCRQENEEKLKTDPARAAWVPLLQYHHGLALKEAGKRAEARVVLEGVIKGSPNRPEAAEAALRWGQSLKDDGLHKMDEAAWGNRTLGDAEAAAVRAKLQQERWQKLKEQVAKKTPPGQTPPVVPLPEVPLADVPLQPAEQKARADYRALIDSFADLALAGDARFELAELHADRNDHDTAIKMLREAL